MSSVTADDVRLIFKAAHDECLAESLKPYPTGQEEFGNKVLAASAWFMLADSGFAQRVADRMNTKESHA